MFKTVYWETSLWIFFIFKNQVIYFYINMEFNNHVNALMYYTYVYIFIEKLKKKNRKNLQTNNLILRVNNTILYLIIFQ